jgi:hypothetical protein
MNPRTLVLLIATTLFVGCSTLIQFYTVARKADTPLQQQQRFSLAILHVEQSAAARLDATLRHLTLAYPGVAVLVVDGTTTLSTAANYTHPLLTFDTMERTTGATGCYARLLTLATSRFVGVGVIHSHALSRIGSHRMRYRSIRLRCRSTARASAVATAPINWLPLKYSLFCCLVVVVVICDVF